MGKWKSEFGELAHTLLSNQYARKIHWVKSVPVYKVADLWFHILVDQFDDTTRALLQRYGFEAERFEVLRKRLIAGDATRDNRLKAEVTPPLEGEVECLPRLGSEERKRLFEVGQAAIERGEVAMVVLAGGMATRFGGVVKATVDAAGGETFLGLKLRDAEAAAGENGRVPIYFMTSFATDDAISRAISEADAQVGDLAQRRPARTFPQHVSARLTEDGALFLSDDGRPSLYATGHGDLASALSRGGVLTEMAEAGVRHFMMSNVDNLTATLDPAIVGFHLESKAPMTAEMVEKFPGDAGGAPARVDGALQIVEGFRFPEDFDQDSIPVFNTNTLMFDVAALEGPFEFSWFAVKKKVDGRTAIQFERLVGEMSAMMRCAFLQVERQGADARFHPIKSPADLDNKRAEIEDVLRTRGIVASS